MHRKCLELIRCVSWSEAIGRTPIEMKIQGGRSSSTPRNGTANTGWGSHEQPTANKVVLDNRLPTPSRNDFRKHNR